MTASDLIEWTMDQDTHDLSVGRAALARGDVGEALARWIPVHARLGNRSGVAADLGWAYYLTGQYQQAEAVLGHAVEHNPEDWNALRGLAWVRLEIRDYAGAEDAFGRAMVQLDEAHRSIVPELSCGLGWSRFHQGKFGAALADFRRGIGHVQSDETMGLQDLQRGLGWALLKTKDAAQAIGAFRAALATPGVSSAHHAADARRGLAEAEAQALATGANLAQLPATSPVHSRVDEHRGLPAESTSPAVLASELKSDLAWALYHKSAYPEAAISFQAALACAPKPPARALSGLGWAQLRCGNLAQAQAAFDQLLAFGANLDRQVAQEGHRGRGWVRFHMRGYDEAIDDFSRALDLCEPGRDASPIQDSLRGRSRAYYFANRLDLALQDARRGGLANSRLGLALHAQRTRMRRIFRSS